MFKKMSSANKILGKQLFDRYLKNIRSNPLSIKKEKLN